MIAAALTPTDSADCCPVCDDPKCFNALCDKGNKEDDAIDGDDPDEEDDEEAQEKGGCCTTPRIAVGCLTATSCLFFAALIFVGHMHIDNSGCDMMGNGVGLSVWALVAGGSGVLCLMCVGVNLADHAFQENKIESDDDAALEIMVGEGEEIMVGEGEENESSHHASDVLSGKETVVAPWAPWLMLVICFMLGWIVYGVALAYKRIPVTASECPHEVHLSVFIMVTIMMCVPSSICLCLCGYSFGCCSCSCCSHGEDEDGHPPDVYKSA